MPKRSSKRPRDVNQLARALVAEATGEAPSTAPELEKNPAAVALGRLGGAKGGTTRAKALTKPQREEIARLAGGARWNKAKR